MASKYITAELQRALDNLSSDQARAADIAKQLTAVRTAYDQAVASLDVEAAVTAWPRVQVLSELHDAATSRVRHVPAWATVQAVGQARQDVQAARSKLEGLVQVVSPRSFADEAVRRASTVGFSAVPEYARSAVEMLSNWHREVAGALGSLGEAERRLVDAQNGKGDLDGVAGLLQQAEAAVSQAEAVAGKAADVRSAVAQANDTFLQGVAS